MGSPVLNGTLTTDDGLHVVTKHGEHSNPTVLDFLDLQLSKSVRNIGQTRRFEGITRVQAVQILTEATSGATVGTLGLGPAHQPNLKGQDGRDGLGMNQAGAAKVLPWQRQ